jgi:thioredoxin 1
MATKAVTDSSFQTDVLDSDKPVVVDFWAEWCGPCKMIGPSLEELSEELGEQVTIVKVNIDENPDAPGKYGVRGIPTMILFKNGEVASTQVGALPKSGIRDWVQRGL